MFATKTIEINKKSVDLRDQESRNYINICM